MEQPELGNRPLIATARDQALVLPRAEVAQVADLARRGLNVLLAGERGAGRTTALHAAAFALREAGGRAEVVDAAPARVLDDVVAAIDAAVARHGGDAGGGGVAAGGGALERVRRWRALDGSVIVMLDDLAPELAQPLFGRLRDELWQTPVRFVVAAPAADAGAFLTPPADVFFEGRVRLEPLGVAEQLELLGRRLPPEDAERAMRAVAGAGASTPREVVGLARQALVEGAQHDELAAAARVRRERVERLGPAASRLLAELEAAGGASASDPRLLERLGWSRQRVAQVAAALEAAGLVAAAPVRGEDRRVRRVFTPLAVPAPPAEGHG
ncbi:MarR family transcriptional regulator [Miltoncostaea marina]|uniref:MarR family transcriptional regulator n=1 Tax=Miltoncostaea marina TaxID=2843215 RepID=UPI001C3C3A54|nr:MarR family transcriptional regulator [Miltoncostaea marina]